jgi:pimeloyl-ACP methyl ester carboxylesterase
VKITRIARRVRLRLIVAAAIVAIASLAIPLSQIASARTADAAAAAGNGPKPSIVLVHGAWADSGSWDGVIKRLQADGYTVYAPPNPLQGLPYDSAYLADFLHSISGPIVLVGHSYGGAVITNAATGDPQVKALVYVDAFAPAQGQTLE